MLNGIKLSREKRNKLGDYLVYLGYFLVILFFGGPLLWILSLSLQTPQELFSYPPNLIPEPFTIKNFLVAFSRGQLFRFLINSFKIASLSTLGTLVVTIPGAYGFSRFRFKGRMTFLVTILLFQMISPLIIAIPLYRYFSRLGLLNTHFGVILVYISFLIPLITWLLKGFFDSIPKSIEESAMISGCSRLDALFKITLPIAAPGIVSASIFAFLLSWSQFIIPFILLNETALYPISVGLFNFQAGRSARDIQLIAAVGVLTVFPPAIIFMLLQRYVVKVLTAGAVKS